MYQNLRYSPLVGGRDAGGPDSDWAALFCEIILAVTAATVTAALWANATESAVVVGQRQD